MADDLREWTPRNRLANALAGGLKSVNAFAAKPFGYDNPPGEMLVNALALPQIANTLERYSYGQPITNAGKANVPYLPSDTADALMAVAPVVAKWPKQAAGAALGLIGAADAGDASRAMNVLFKKGTWADRPTLLPDGTIEIPMPTPAQRPMSEYADKARDIAFDEFRPKYGNFFRFTNNKNEPSIAARGELRNSINHAENFDENGVSVADGAHYGVQGYSHGYEVNGDVIGIGSDGEKLLDAKTIKVLSKLKTSAEIVKKDRVERARILKKAGLPDDYMDRVDFINSPSDPWR